MSADTLSTTFAALADPTRRAILSRLMQGDATVSALAEPFHMTLPAVTKHLKVLENAGLIARSRDAQWRPCALRAAPLKEASHWLDDYRKHWEQRLDRLEMYLQTLQNEQAISAAPKSTSTVRTTAKRGVTHGKRAMSSRAPSRKKTEH